MANFVLSRNVSVANKHLFMNTTNYLCYTYLCAKPSNILCINTGQLNNLGITITIYSIVWMIFFLECTGNDIVVNYLFLRDELQTYETSQFLQDSTYGNISFHVRLSSGLLQLLLSGKDKQLIIFIKLLLGTVLFVLFPRTTLAVHISFTDYIIFILLIVFFFWVETPLYICVTWLNLHGY